MEKSEHGFRELGLPGYLLKVLQLSGYVSPTEQQEVSIPVILKGGDVLVQAKTGTGKTASFSLPSIININKNDHPKNSVHTLVLAPTRELVNQTGEFYKKYSANSPRQIKTVCIIGGVEHSRQINVINRGVDVVIATPGRLEELLANEHLNLHDIKMLIIDEADKLLGMGFTDQINAILNYLPRKRQTLLFSATYPDNVKSLADKLLKNPARLKVSFEQLTTVEKIDQRIIEVNRDNRRALLQHLIKSEKWEHALIFVASKTAANNLARKLGLTGIKAMGFHGDLTQDERERTLDRFKAKKVTVLVATDIAARGIDFLNLSHVVNYDLPRSPQDYIHRIGRTGRAGKTGTAISFLHHENMKHFLLIEKRIKQKLKRTQVKNFELTGESPLIQRRAAPVKGKRKSKKDKLRESLNMQK